LIGLKSYRLNEQPCLHQLLFTRCLCYFAGDESTPEIETEMTSSAHGRDRRSADDNMVMTAEHMKATGDAAKVNKPTRLKRDLHDYIYRRRWNSPGNVVTCVSQGVECQLFSGFQWGGNWDFMLTDPNCWNIDILADLAEVLPIIVWQYRNLGAVLVSNLVGLQSMKRQNTRHALITNKWSK